MSTFIVNPHGCLQEWIADEKGYFTQMVCGFDQGI